MWSEMGWGRMSSEAKASTLRNWVLEFACVSPLCVAAVKHRRRACTLAKEASYKKVDLLILLLKKNQIRILLSFLKGEQASVS